LNECIELIPVVYFNFEVHKAVNGDGTLMLRTWCYLRIPRTHRSSVFLYCSLLIKKARHYCLTRSLMLMVIRLKCSHKLELTSAPLAKYSKLLSTSAGKKSWWFSYP